MLMQQACQTTSDNLFRASGFVPKGLRALRFRRAPAGGGSADGSVLQTAESALRNGAAQALPREGLAGPRSAPARSDLAWFMLGADHTLVWSASARRRRTAHCASALASFRRSLTRPPRGSRASLNTISPVPWTFSTVPPSRRNSATASRRFIAL